MTALRTRRLDTPLGTMLATASDAGLTSLVFDEASAPSPCNDPVLDAIEAWVTAYFTDATTPMTVPLDLHGSAFDRAVWQAVADIPAGQTRTYGELAALVGKPRGAQAVGGANGRNPVALVVPCHRVLGRDGALTGYAWGVHRKRTLLEHEGALPASLPFAR